MDVRSLFAAQQYAASRPATEPEANGTGAGAHLAAAAEDFTETLRTAEANAQSAMTGDADPHALVQALAQSELAVDTVVTLRNKVVEAYQELLRMPV
ncbi:flagellar hook-basal body complex protein FliE [Alloyangia pacifica]|uniref:flagellar hook-basal body complex protein FliE n=1 Tax=Alloyangia pacifica TaxID=311180 RepID=UPI001CD2FB18|nr:flagellar hook-basal body complex protein FliE [Alloyangia pacifica]MCA0995420.1 flagellar hook-basal body complex protein FliE [Alloyangia pacifica]